MWPEIIGGTLHKTGYENSEYPHQRQLHHHSAEDTIYLKAPKICIEVRIGGLPFIYSARVGGCAMRHAHYSLHLWSHMLHCNFLSTYLIKLKLNMLIGTDSSLQVIVEFVCIIRVNVINIVFVFLMKRFGAPNCYM